MAFMNTISLIIKHTFIYSKHTVFFLDVQVYLSESWKFMTKFYKKTHWLYGTTSLVPLPLPTHSTVKKVSLINMHFHSTWSSLKTISYQENSMTAHAVFWPPTQTWANHLQTPSIRTVIQLSKIEQHSQPSSELLTNMWLLATHFIIC